MEGALTLSWRDMGRTAGILCAASLVGLLFYKAGITEANIVTVYLLAVLCTALATDGRVYGISAAVASVLVFNYLFTVPRFTLKFNDVSRYSVTFLVMFIAACITSTLTMRVKTQARQAARKAHRSEVLLETSQALQRAEGEQQIFTAAAEHLSRLLRAGVSLYPVRDGALQPPLVCDAQGTEAAPCTTERELRAARTVLRCGGQAGARTAACPDAECLYLAVGASVPPLAVAGVALRKGHIPDDFDRNLMAALLNECALALEKERIAREKSDAELQAQQEQLRANLLRTISHDLRTPLTSISGNAGVLMENSSVLDEAKKQRLYADIYDDSMWLVQLVENLLSITRLENGGLDLRIQPELLEEVAGEALQHLNRRSAEYPIRVDIEDDLLMAKMDSRLITQVIINIVNNAVKYTPPGTDITLSAPPRGRHGAGGDRGYRPRHSAGGTGQAVPDVLYRGQRPRRRTAGAGPGPGAVQVHCGGARREDRHAGQRAPRLRILFYPASRGDKAMNKAKILVVEDDKAVRNLITTTLETQNYQYHTAEKGSEALLEAVSFQPDVMLLDLGLPDMDGIAIIEKVRGWSGMPIIVISARSEDRDKIDALDAGADDYLTKPFSVDELLARLRVALRRARQDSGHAGAPEAVFTNGELKIDYAAGCTYLAGQEVHLTPIEYKLLCLLAKNVGKVLTHNFILKEVWGSALPGDTPSLRVFMATLRKKIEPVPAQPKYIQTHVGVGYRMLRIAEGEPVQKNG